MNGVISWGFGQNGVDVETTANSFCNGAWHHVVVTFNGLTGKVFIDGAAATVTAYNMAVPSSNGCTLTSPSANSFTAVAAGVCNLNFNHTDPLAIGGYYGSQIAGVGAPFVGAIDEVTIWNRALTDAEALAVP